MKFRFWTMQSLLIAWNEKLSRLNLPNLLELQNMCHCPRQLCAGRTQTSRFNLALSSGYLVIADLAAALPADKKLH